MQQRPLGTYRVPVPESRLRVILARPGSMHLRSETPHFAEMFTTWSLGPVVLTRDSSPLDRANWIVLSQLLFEFADQFEVIHMSHWACGWCDHLAFHAAVDGKATPLCEALEGWFQIRTTFPAADHDVWDAVIAGDLDVNLRRTAQELGVKLSDRKLIALRRHLTRTAPTEMEIRDGQAPYPETEVVEPALRALGFLKPQEAST